jgi:hypothetical protein
MQGSMGQFAAHCGDAEQSIRLIADARHRLPRSAPAVAGIWLDAIESLALAEARDRNALTKLEHAEARLARTINDEPVWPWIFRFDERKLAGFRAQAANKLGRNRLAQKALQIAYDPHQAPKPRAVMETLRAAALARAGHIEEACRIATDALNVGQTYDSERVLRSVATFRNALGANAGRATAELDERLYGTYREDL